jgi:intracellular sulfur oxidation DsrE/DsrF family protein
MPFAWTRVFLMTNQMVGVPEEEVQAVLILRHDAIPLAMESSLWKKYSFSKVFNVLDEQTKKPITTNVFWQPKDGTLPLPGMGINDLMKSGVLIGVCEMAITHYSMVVAGMRKLKAEDVKKEWIAGVLPGIQLVPSGVLAVNRAQERGCAYCFAG